jgi:hypothetical protein
MEVRMKRKKKAGKLKKTKFDQIELHLEKLESKPKGLTHNPFSGLLSLSLGNSKQQEGHDG